MEEEVGVEEGVEEVIEGVEEIREPEEEWGVS